ncbi:DUF2950 domain-containing protein [Cupriavidus pinatubonensis]|nr:DUF2950 domain-containing protein [Cupriavidus pinatubonensis]
MNARQQYWGMRRCVKAWSVLTALLFGLGAVPGAHGHQAFASPEVAMRAFGDAIWKDDKAALKRLLGANFRDFIPPVGADVRYRFLSSWEKSHEVQLAVDRAYIAVGDDGWTLPIPLVKSGKGWQFDTRAGAEEMHARRIERNELAVIQTMLAIHDAVNEYALIARDSSGVVTYAANPSRSHGKDDGAHWPTRSNKPGRPFCPGFVGAGTLNAGKDGYHGYHYKLLTSQGPHAPGGARNYVVNDEWFGGFALIAWPIRYQKTGLMSFMVSHEGQVYERDMGADGAAKAAAMKSFDPGFGWRKVSP